MLKNLKYQLILGSKSPRRQELLKSGGFDFEVRTQDGDENFPEDMPHIKVAEYLSQKKAAQLVSSLKENELLITADSIVIIGEKILNKPENYEDAIDMLSLLSDSWHTVATGVCLTTSTKSKSFTVFTKVKFDNIQKEEMEYYITKCQPFDKAGGYGIQDWIGLCKVAEISGSYSNVMGLPMRELYVELMNF